MKKRIFSILICVILLFAAVALTACGNEAEALQERIDALESENAELQSTVSSLNSDLERSRADLFTTQSELQNVQAAIAAADDDEQSDNANQSGPLAITYAGEPNTDMSWPLNHGELQLGIRMNPDEFDEEDEIIWQSADEDIFTVEQNEDGTSAIVTPLKTGSAQLIVTVGNQETRSWVRIT